MQRVGVLAQRSLLPVQVALRKRLAWEHVADHVPHSAHSQLHTGGQSTGRAWFWSAGLVPHNAGLAPHLESDPSPHTDVRVRARPLPQVALHALHALHVQLQTGGHWGWLVKSSSSSFSGRVPHSESWFSHWALPLHCCACVESGVVC